MRVWGLGFRVKGYCKGSGVWGLGFRVWGSGLLQFQFWGSELRVLPLIKFSDPPNIANGKKIEKSSSLVSPSPSSALRLAN